MRIKHTSQEQELCAKFKYTKIVLKYLAPRRTLILNQRKYIVYTRKLHYFRYKIGGDESLTVRSVISLSSAT